MGPHWTSFGAGRCRGGPRTAPTGNGPPPIPHRGERSFAPTFSNAEGRTAGLYPFPLDGWALWVPIGLRSEQAGVGAVRESPLRAADLLLSPIGAKHLSPLRSPTRRVGRQVSIPSPSMGGPCGSPLDFVRSRQVQGRSANRLYGQRARIWGGRDPWMKVLRGHLVGAWRRSWFESLTTMVRQAHHERTQYPAHREPVERSP